MRCEVAREALTEERYGGVPLDAPARRHIKDCQPCQRFVRHARTLDAWLSRDAAQGAGPDFDARFFAQLSEQRAEHSRRGVRRWVFLLLPVAVGAAIAMIRVPPDPAPAPLSEDEVRLLRNLELIEKLDATAQIDEPRQRLPVPEQQVIRQSFLRDHTLSKTRRERLRATLERMDRMSIQERQELMSKLQRWRTLSASQREQVRSRIRHPSR